MYQFVKLHPQKKDCLEISMRFSNSGMDALYRGEVRRGPSVWIVPILV